MAVAAARLEMAAEMFKASGKLSTLSSVYSKLDPDFKTVVDGIIDNHRPGFSLLRLLRLDTVNIQAPGGLLKALVDRYDLNKHYFIINDNVLNITLEDVLYITGLPITGKAVISATSRDENAFSTAFGLPKGKVYVCTLRTVVSDKNRPNEQRLQALLLIVIVCFVSPVCEDYQVHNYLVQFVTNMELVDSYSWGAAFLASLYVGIEKYKSTLIKKMRVDGNCWPLLVFFCIRIPQLCEGLGISINLEGQKAPLLSHCMKLMKKPANNKVLQAASLVEKAFSDLKRENPDKAIDVSMSYVHNLEESYKTRVRMVLCSGKPSVPSSMSTSRSYWSDPSGRSFSSKSSAQKPSSKGRGIEETEKLLEHFFDKKDITLAEHIYLARTLLKSSPSCKLVMRLGTYDLQLQHIKTLTKTCDGGGGSGSGSGRSQ